MPRSLAIERGELPAPCPLGANLQRRLAKRPMDPRRMPLRIAETSRFCSQTGYCFAADGPAPKGMSERVRGSRPHRWGAAKPGKREESPAQHCIPTQFLLQRSVERVAGAALVYVIKSRPIRPNAPKDPASACEYAAQLGPTAGNAWQSSRIRECPSRKPPTRRPESCRPTRVPRLPAPRGCSAA